MRLINIIESVYDGKDQQRDWQATTGIMLHRCGVNLVDNKVLGYDGQSVAEAFIGKRKEWLDVAKATGNQNAYSLMIGSDCGPGEYDGQVWQCLPLDEIGWHGRQFSKGHIGVAWIADPRVKALSQKAYAAGVDLCAMLCAARGWDPYKAVRGHGEVAGSHDGSKAPGKPNACPGLSQKDLNGFRYDVAKIMQERALLDLNMVGLVFK